MSWLAREGSATGGRASIRAAVLQPRERPLACTNPSPSTMAADTSRTPRRSLRRYFWAVHVELPLTASAPAHYGTDPPRLASRGALAFQAARSVLQTAEWVASSCPKNRRFFGVRVRGAATVRNCKKTVLGIAALADMREP